MRDSRSFRDDEPPSWPLIGGALALLFATLALHSVRRPQPRSQPKPQPTPRRAPASRIGRPSPVMPPPPRPLVVPAPKGELKLPPAWHEPEDVGPRFIAGAFALLFGSLALITLGVLWLFPMQTTDRVLNTPLPTYPAPRLQPDPRADMQRFLAAELQELNSTGWVDKAHGIVHLPIDVAMDQLAQRGIPGWPDAGNQTEGATAGSAASVAAARGK